METRTINVYDFKELKQDVKDKVIERFREHNQYDFLTDNLKDELTEFILPKHKIKIDYNFKIYYDLGYCQGDFFNFYGVFNWKCYKVIIKSDNDITIETLQGNDAKDSIYQEFEELYKDICKAMKKFGYDLIEEEDKEENIIDIIDCNDYKFLSNGEIYRETE